MDKIPRVFASEMPAWAVAHAWIWSSDEGIKLSIIKDENTKNKKISFTFPKGFDKSRLDVPICIYTVPSDSFNFTETEKMGETYDSKVPVRPISSKRYNLVTEAIKASGGEIYFSD